MCHTNNHLKPRQQYGNSMKQLIPAYLLLLSGCASAIPDITNVHISAIGSDSPGEFCSDFSLTDNQAFEFLGKSREVTIEEFHNDYDYLPCYVKGVTTWHSSKCEFEIRAGGTVELSCENGEGYLLVCDACDYLLGGK